LLQLITHKERWRERREKEKKKVVQHSLHTARRWSSVKIQSRTRGTKEATTKPISICEPGKGINEEEAKGKEEKDLQRR
jgi:hypothetical protein